MKSPPLSNNSFASTKSLLSGTQNQHPQQSPISSIMNKVNNRENTIPIQKLFQDQENETSSKNIPPAFRKHKKRPGNVINNGNSEPPRKRRRRRNDTEELEIPTETVEFVQKKQDEFKQQQTEIRNHRAELEKQLKELKEKEQKNKQQLEEDFMSKYFEQVKKCMYLEKVVERLGSENERNNDLIKSLMKENGQKNDVDNKANAKIKLDFYTLKRKHCDLQVLYNRDQEVLKNTRIDLNELKNINKDLNSKVKTLENGNKKLKNDS